MDNINLAYLIVLVVTTTLAFGIIQYALLIVRSSNPIFSLILVIAGFSGFGVASLIELPVSGEKLLVQVGLFLILIGAVGAYGAKLNKAIPVEKRSLSSTLGRFIDHYRSLK